MKKLLIIATAAALTACGYTGKDIEAVGQVKRVVQNTPLLCPDFYDIDLSLGVMRNGVGSMSTQDIWIVVNKADLPLVKKANEDGTIIKVTYDAQRFPICTSGRLSTKVEVSQ